MDCLEERVETKEAFDARVYRNWEKYSIDKKPYDATPAIVDLVWDMAGRGCDDFRARRILYWFKENFSSTRGGDYQSASQSFVSKKGLCVNSAILYTTMAKIAGLNSFVALVTKKGNGRPMSHMCSGVYLDSRLVLVDPSLKVFDPVYREFRVFDDATARSVYYGYILKFNERNKEAAFKFEDKIIKEIPPHINYRSNYYNQCKKYKEFTDKKINEKIVESVNNQTACRQEPFAERFVDSLAIDFAKVAFFRFLRVLAVPAAFSIGIGLNDTIELGDLYNAIKYPFIEKNYNSENVQSAGGSGRGIIYGFAENVRDAVFYITDGKRVEELRNAAKNLGN